MNLIKDLYVENEDYIIAYFDVNDENKYTDIV